MLRTCGQITDITGADLWVMDPAVRYIDDVKPMLENNLYRVRGVKVAGRCLFTRAMRAKVSPAGGGDEKTVIEQVILLGLDDVTLVGAPPSLEDPAGNITDLRLPDAVMVDDVRLEKLYPDEKKKDHFPDGNAFYRRFLHRQFEMNDHRRGCIVAVCTATPDFPDQPRGIHHLQPRQEFCPPGAEDPLVHPGQGRDRDGTKEAVADRIRSRDRAQGQDQR